MEEILEKIKKLMRHAESAKNIGSFEEAEAFASKIQELMLQYNIEHIEMKDDAFDEIKEEKYDGINSTWWHKLLIGHIAKYNFVKIFKVDSRSSLIIGKKINIENAVWLFNFIKTKIWYAAYYETRKQGKKDPLLNTNQFKKNFYFGAVKGFADKLFELKNSQANVTAINSLILATDARIMDFVRAKYKIVKGGATRVAGYEGEGFGSGYKTGKNLEIGRPLPISQKRLN